MTPTQESGATLAALSNNLADAVERADRSVDRILEERTAPVRARVAELRADGERRVEEGRARLAEERADFRHSSTRRPVGWVA